MKLHVTADQIRALRELQATFAAARNTIATIAVEARTTNRPWQTINFRADGAVHVDARTFRLMGDAVSLFTTAGRQRIAFRLGAFQRTYLQRGRVREAELVNRGDRWFLNVVLDLPAVAACGAGGVLGVDLGENVAAATSDGSLYGGGQLRESRDRFLALRRRLQGNGSQSAKQLLRKVSGRESRHVHHVNHTISAKIVAEALERRCGTIALENLRDIRGRIKAGKRMRTPCGVFAHSDRNAARNIAKIAARALTATGVVMRPDVAA